MAISRVAFGVDHPIIGWGLAVSPQEERDEQDEGEIAEDRGDRDQKVHRLSRKQRQCEPRHDQEREHEKLDGSFTALGCRSSDSYDVVRHHGMAEHRACLARSSLCRLRGLRGNGTSGARQITDLEGR